MIPDARHTEGEMPVSGKGGRRTAMGRFAEATRMIEGRKTPRPRRPRRYRCGRPQAGSAKASPQFPARLTEPSDCSFASIWSGGR